jgi:hypothetical protein
MIADLIVVMTSPKGEQDRDDRGHGRRFGESPLHKFCTVGRAQRQDSVILREIVAGEPVSRIVRAALQTNKMFGINRQ